MSIVTMLTYQGEGAYRPSLPARDLDRGDLEVIAARDERAVDDIVAEAVGSGLYVATYADDDAPADDPEASARKDAPDPLEDSSTTRPKLVEIAEALELTVASRDTKAAIVQAIRAEQTRRADEAAAAAAQASDSGASSGGEGTPADDPDATATGEAGSPPSEGAGA